MCELGKELRIGNLLMYSDNSGIWEVSGIHEFGIDCFDDIEETYIEYENFEPVPLTEELLIDYGFKWSHFHPDTAQRQYYIFEDFGVELYDKKYYKHGVELRSLHQLQNLYFALTGKELTHQKIN